jgi:hypothetical protein
VNTLGSIAQQAASLLVKVKQSPQLDIVIALKECLESLVLVNLLRHKDNDVKLLIILYINGIMIILALDAPHNDE